MKNMIALFVMLSLVGSAHAGEPERSKEKICIQCLDQDDARVLRDKLLRNQRLLQEQGHAVVRQGRIEAVPMISRPLVMPAPLAPPAETNYGKEGPTWNR